MMLVAAPTPEAAPGVREHLNDHDLQLAYLCGRGRQGCGLGDRG